MLRLLLDEDSKSKALIRRLSDMGHDVKTTADFDLDGQSDSVVLERARKESRVLLTKNCTDFREIHEATPDHQGILLVFQEPGSIMSSDDITNAIGNLEKSGAPIAGQCQSLNSWQY